MIKQSNWPVKGKACKRQWD